jgi:hypothetical protein
MWNVFSYLRTDTRAGLLRRRYWTLGFSVMMRTSWVTGGDPLEGFSSVELAPILTMCSPFRYPAQTTHCICEYLFYLPYLKLNFKYLLLLHVSGEVNSRFDDTFISRIACPLTKDNFLTLTIWWLNVKWEEEERHDKSRYNAERNNNTRTLREVNVNGVTAVEIAFI